MLAVKCSLVLSSKSTPTPICELLLSVVPSSTVPNLRPSIVENRVLIINASPACDTPDTTP